MEETIGHGCPIGMDRIPLSDTFKQSLERQIKKDFPVYRGIVILKDKKDPPEKLTYKGIIYYREPLAPPYVPPHQNSKEYIKECKENFKRIAKERLANGTAYEKDGIVWYKAKK